MSSIKSLMKKENLVVKNHFFPSNFSLSLYDNRLLGQKVNK